MPGSSSSRSKTILPRNVARSVGRVDTPGEHKICIPIINPSRNKSKTVFGGHQLFEQKMANHQIQALSVVVGAFDFVTGSHILWKARAVAIYFLGSEELTPKRCVILLLQRIL